MSKANYERLVSQHNRELIEGTVASIAKSAREGGIDKGILKERERIISIIIASELGDYDAGFLIAKIRGEK